MAGAGTSHNAAVIQEAHETIGGKGDHDLGTNQSTPTAQGSPPSGAHNADAAGEDQAKQTKPPMATVIRPNKTQVAAGSQGSKANEAA